MKLTKELCEAVVAGYLLGAAEKPVINRHGFTERSPHQRRRGRPPENGYRAIEVPKMPVLTKKRKYTKKSAYWDK